jgi:uncharacterized protein (DUF1697 family)
MLQANRQIAFLRAINVGGRIVKMDALREHFRAIGLNGVETYIASGNVIFDAPGEDEAKLRARIEAHLAQALGYPVDTFLRSTAELHVLASKPAFDAAQRAAAGALNVAFLHAPLTPAQQSKLASFETAIDHFEARGRELWWLCRVKQSESRFSNGSLERQLGLRATLRGYPTIQKLAARLPVD